MKKIIAIACSLIVGVLSMTFSTQAVTAEPESHSNVLIAYFSRAGENYSVGVIEKGNTELLAEIIADETGGDLFRIEPVVPYPEGYEDTKKALGGFVDAAMIHKQNELIFQAFEASERRYQDRLSMLKAQQKGALSPDFRDDYDEMLEEFSLSGDVAESPGMDAEALQEDVSAAQ